ncbi:MULTISPECIES: DUF4199 domain-containing protein [Emticicia]|uniref:DUF4199 domain-containing protein n=1 Tax=Emticicia TaxID=312278 RepID=UPI00209F3DE0|nr:MULTISPECIES: DUF4199 domain-containing protein [Emticicia]UTA67207.1 DUF4199 domain-containing protein [Emticicia sp. 21SJ11W-3]
MKRIVLVSGLIAGLIVSTFMVCSTAYCYATQQFEGSIWVGYASMLLAFSLVFVGIKNYRDKHKNGVISFGQAFKVGLLISLVASTVYVVVWTIDYYVFVPDFMEVYSTRMIEKAKASGETAANIQEEIAMIQQSAGIYKSPLGVIAFTYFEILPVGLLVTLISALILKRKQAVAG